MAESHKFKTLSDAEAVFPDLPWQQDGGGSTAIFDEKQDQYIPVTKGQYIVKVANRYEVKDEEPEKAKPAETPKTEKKPTTDSSKEDTTGTSGIVGAQPAPVAAAVDGEATK